MGEPKRDECVDGFLPIYRNIKAIQEGTKMKKHFSIIALFVLPLFIIFSCKDENNNTPSEQEMQYMESDDMAKSVTDQVVKANSQLAVKIFDAVCRQEKGNNVMISPLSISIALAMALQGASGENIEEMKSVLGFNDMDIETINNDFFYLINSLENADRDMLLAIANSVWMDKMFEPCVKKSFLESLKKSYSAEPYCADFKSQTAVDEINQWVSANTMERIEKIITEIDPLTVMYLINAVYFKAAWKITFDKGLTEKSVFTLENGQEKEAYMMRFKDNQELYFYSSPWGEKSGYTAVRIPYGRDKFAFYGFIPHFEQLDSFISRMDDEGIESFFSDLTPREIPVLLPRFKFKYEKSLVDLFKLLGMKKAFSPGGFLNLAEDIRDLYISDIIHKTFIEVNEEGTEAAAVTAVEINKTSLPAGFYAVKPFIFVIRDDRSGTILFMGRIEDPTI